MQLPRLIFVSDPLCSWCYGMGRAVDEARARLAGQVACELRIGGINTEAVSALPARALDHFRPLWARVTEVTGAEFAMRLPADADFVYNSTAACASVVAARQASGEEPFDYLHALQRVFFIEGRNPNARRVQCDVAATVGVPLAAFERALDAPDTVARMRAEMTAARGYGTNALPAVLIARAATPALLAGGYVDADTLVEQVHGFLARG